MNKQPQFPVPKETLEHLKAGLAQFHREKLEYRPDSSISDLEIRVHLAVLDARRDVMFNLINTLYGV